MAKPPRLREVDVIDLPVREASGVASKLVDGVVHVVVIGDRNADLGVATHSAEDGFSSWRTVDLADVDGWVEAPDGSQLEAIAVDGGEFVALLREDPPVAVVIGVDQRRVVAEVSLVVPDDLCLDGWDDPSSRGEGLLMLTDGRLLVAKEKRPSALVEFCPPGVDARGVSPTDLLGDGERWRAPVGAVESTARPAWLLDGAAADALRDVSDLAAGRDGSLWLLSDQSESVARLSLEPRLVPGGGAIRSLDDVWRLPKGVDKPEGVVALDGRRALVAMDTRRRKHNGMVVAAPD